MNAVKFQQFQHVWKQSTVFILLITIIGSLGIYVYAQHQYALMREVEHQEQRRLMHTFREELASRLVQSGPVTALTSVEAAIIQSTLAPLFQVSPELLRLSVLDTEANLMAGKERPFIMAYFQSANGVSLSSEEQARVHMLLLHGPYVIQLPILLNQEPVGILRGEFMSVDSGATLMQLTRVSLQTTIVALGGMVVFGLALIVTQITQRFALKQHRLEAYVLSLEKANEDLQRAKKDLQISEKLASLGYLAAGIAHEIGNPLGAALGYIELLQKTSLDREKMHDILQRTQKEIERIRRILQELVHFSRPHSMRLVTVDINDVVRKVVSRLPSFPEKTIEIRQHLTDFALLADIDEHKLQSVLYNILCNALDAIPGAGQIQISTSRRIHESTSIIGGSEVIAIQISDTGVGIPKELLAKVFEPFFTTKDPGKGMGLGLPLCHRIIESLNGEISIQSTVGKGTDVTIFLPPARKKTGPS